LIEERSRTVDFKKDSKVIYGLVFMATVNITHMQMNRGGKEPWVFVYLWSHHPNILSLKILFP